MQMVQVLEIVLGFGLEISFDGISDRAHVFNGRGIGLLGLVRLHK